jgi:hypothetical protein
MLVVGLITVNLRAKTVKQAQQTLSTAVLIILFLPVIAYPTIPDSWKATVARLAQSDRKVLMAAGLASAMLLMQALLFLLAALRFKRGRLIL